MRRRLPLPLLLVATLLVWTIAPGPVRAETRVALVIGNSNYAALPSLENPGNDALDVGIALEGLGFDVLDGMDLTRREMEDLADRFARAVRGADVALLFYAGHGFQAAGQNFLVPIDARITGAADVTEQTTPLALFLDALSEAPGAKLVFLDACRDDPFGGAVQDPSVSDGLARVGSDADFLFAYATQPDNVAYDGTGRNSFFTEALLNHIYTPGQDVGDMMISVRRDVLAATGGRQVPWDNSSLTRRVVFDPSPATVTEETLLYQVAAREEEPSLMQLYLERYPDGAHADEALAALGGGGGGNDIGITRALPSGGDDAQADRLWQLARRTRLRTLVTYYLERYPNGVHVEEAERMLELLPSDAVEAAGPRCERLATHPRDATAGNPGVPFERLQLNAVVARQACLEAVTRSPELPHYIALLARATAAGGDLERAVTLYGEAASRGDLRAMVSLAQLMEQGIGLPADPDGALALVRAAAERGSPDAMINLAVSLLETGDEAASARAAELLRRAADAGSPLATYNLGVLAQDGALGELPDALGYFIDAARAGEAAGYRSAAILLDEGRGVAADPGRAADMLLRAVAEDDGTTFRDLTATADAWSSETLAELQSRLARAGFYEAGIDGIPGPEMAEALKVWRAGGFTAEVLGPVED